MARSPMMPFWTDAYLGDTRHLTTLEHGAYMLLLITAWRSKDGTLPDDDKTLARFAGLTVDKWKKIRPVIEQFFDVENGEWAQGRLLDERKADFEFRKNQSEKAKARHLKNKETTHADASLRHMPPPSPSPSQTDTNVSVPHTPTEQKTDLENQAVELYNIVAKRHGLPVAQKITNARKTKIRSRLKDCGGIEGWESALEKLSNSDFCMGKNKNGWKADLDFLLQESSFVKLMEGKYDNQGIGGYSHGKQTNFERISEQGKALLDDIRAGKYSQNDHGLFG